jgi:hypothetical protein
MLIVFALMLVAAVAQRSTIRATDLTKLCAGVVDYQFIIPEVCVLRTTTFAIDEMLCSLRCLTSDCAVR